MNKLFYVISFLILGLYASPLNATTSPDQEKPVKSLEDTSNEPAYTYDERTYYQDFGNTTYTSEGVTYHTLSFGGQKPAYKGPPPSDNPSSYNYHEMRFYEKINSNNNQNITPAPTDTAEEEKTAH